MAEVRRLVGFAPSAPPATVVADPAAAFAGAVVKEMPGASLSAEAFEARRAELAAQASARERRTRVGQVEPRKLGR